MARKVTRVRTSTSYRTKILNTRSTQTTVPHSFEPRWPYDPSGAAESYWNHGKPWGEIDIHDLKWGLAKGRSVERIAVEVQYPPDEVRAKMRELGLKPKAK